MTNINTKSKITPTYNNLFHIWLVSKDKDVLIKKFDIKHETLAIKDLTIETNEFNELLSEMENNWHLFCDIENLKLLETFASYRHSASNAIYFIELNLDQKQKRVIEESYNGKFFFYKNLIDKLSPFKLDHDLKESFYSLLSWLDKD